MPAPRIRPCLRLIPLSVKCIRVSARVWKSKQSGRRVAVRTPRVLINERMQLLNVVLTGGQIHDSEAAVTLLKGIKLKGKTILADKAYSSKQIRFFIAEHGAVACIPPISGLSMTLILNCINNAISSSGFFNASRIIATSPLVTTNWLFALRISFYSLLLLFTFNLPTTPSCLLLLRQ